MIRLRVQSIHIVSIRQYVYSCCSNIYSNTHTNLFITYRIYIYRKGDSLSGIYPDKIFHRYEVTYRSVGLVAEAPRGTYLLIDGRRLDPGNQFVPVKEGSELTLECAAEGGNPPPDLAWGMTLSQATLDGPEQPPDNLTVLPSTSGRRSGAHLKVLRGHHNATIACVARHVTLTIPMNASILLDVQCEFLCIIRFFISLSPSCF